MPLKGINRLLVKVARSRRRGPLKRMAYAQKRLAANENKVKDLEEWFGKHRLNPKADPRMVSHSRLEVETAFPKKVDSLERYQRHVRNHRSNLAIEKEAARSTRRFWLGTARALSSPRSSKRPQPKKST